MVSTPEDPLHAPMRPRLAILLAAISWLALTPAAAAGVRMVTREEPLPPPARSLAAEGRVLPARKAPLRFNLVGMHWRGGGVVWFRTRADRGPWSAWSRAMQEADDLPDPGSPEEARDGWRLGNPWWTGSARWIQYRIEGDVERLRAYFLRSQPSKTRRLAISGTPSIISRAGWEADESIVRAPPSYAPRLRLAIVHHTAGRNDYGPEESVAIVRGIETYHVKANGWNDIGYNFLVDKYGQVFEGRAGGVDRNVVGAHAQGFNTGSTGVAILGNYQGGPVSPDAEAALESLLAWRLDAGHVDPLSTPVVVSGGNGRFAAGTPVAVHAVSGHRDTGDTECPGDSLYAELSSISAAAAGIGLPKLYEPVATPAGLAAGEPIVFGARLSEPLPWSVTVTDGRTGTLVASGAGSGAAVSWIWDGTGQDGMPVDPAGSYVATVAAEGGVLPATVRLSGASTPPPGATGLSVMPGVLTPNGDGRADTTRITFQLTAPARVRVSLEDMIGVTVATVAPERALNAGLASLDWDGATQTGEPVPDGSYRLVVAARANGRTVLEEAGIVVDRTLGGVVVSPRHFSPNGDGRRDTLSLSFELARDAEVRVLLRRGRQIVATLAAGTLAAGLQQIAWDGAPASSRLADGPYVAVVEATTAVGTRRLGSPVIADTTPPRLSVLSASSRGGSTKVRFSLSEAARVKVWTDAGAISLNRSAGPGTFSAPVSTRRVRLRAWDAAGNVSKAVSVRARS